MTVQVGETLNRLTKVLEGAGVDTPRLDARLLVAAATEQDPKDILLHASQTLTDRQYELLDEYVARRCAGEPISRIGGEREFWGLSFALSPYTLDPRPDSETLVSALLSSTAETRDLPRRVLDVGTGSGCLLLSLLSEWPQATGVGLDIEFGAASTARLNSDRLGLSRRSDFITGNWLSCLAGRFDVIVSNPPYIPTATISELEAEVRLHDPLGALDGGVDGLLAYRQVIPQCARHLASPGILALEIGIGQSEDVAEILREAGFKNIELHNDLSGQARCITSWAD